MLYRHERFHAWLRLVALCCWIDAALTLVTGRAVEWAPWLAGAALVCSAPTLWAAITGRLDEPPPRSTRH